MCVFMWPDVIFMIDTYVEIFSNLAIKAVRYVVNGCAVSVLLFTFISGLSLTVKEDAKKVLRAYEATKGPL